MRKFVTKTRTKSSIYALVLNLLSKRVIFIYKFILVLVGILVFIDYLCITIFECLFDKDIAAVIRGTNWDESAEFLEMYFTIELLGTLAAFIILFIAGYFILEVYLQKDCKFIPILGLSLVCVGGIQTIRHPILIVEEGVLGKIVTLSSHDENIPNLKDYWCNPVLETDTLDRPQHLVMIIGESFAKSHSSLYGYEKSTNPRLSSLVKHDSLLLYKNVQSVGLTTIPAFKTMMSTYRLEYKDSCEWYRCLHCLMYCIALAFEHIGFLTRVLKGYLIIL